MTSRKAGARAVPCLRTERLILRMGRVPDAGRVLDYLVGNREFLAPFEPSKPSGYYTEAFWREQFARSLQEFHSEQSVRLFLFRAESPDDGGGPVIGTVNLTGIFRGPFQACLLGYGLAERAQGNGYMAEALRAVIGYAFGDLALHRVMANYMPHNLRSARVLERLGFSVEGHAKDYILIQGAWRDHVLTSLVNPNWRGG